MFRDLIGIVIEGLKLFSTPKLLMVVLSALLLAGLCWFVCSYYTRLWNKTFHVSIRHHLICAVSALFTFFFILMFVGVRNLKFVSEKLVMKWSQDLQQDEVWNDKTYCDAFYAVKKSGKEDFNGIPAPGQSGCIIPFTDESSLIITSNLYASAACLDFSERHPFLTKLLSAKPSISVELIKKDMDDYFMTGNNIYPVERAINLAARQIRGELLSQTKRIVYLARSILIVLFILIQAIPFGFIGYCAYQDLKIFN